MAGEPHHDNQHSGPHVERDEIAIQPASNNQSLDRILDLPDLVVKLGCLNGTVSTCHNHREKMKKCLTSLLVMLQAITDLLTPEALPRAILCGT